MLEKSRGVVALVFVAGVFLSIIEAIWKYNTVGEVLELMSPLGTIFGTILGSIAGFYFNAKVVDQVNAQSDAIAREARELVDIVRPLNDQYIGVLGLEGDKQTQLEEVNSKLRAKMGRIESFYNLRKQGN